MVKVNGEELDIAGTSIAEYLKTADYCLERIVVECNEVIIPKTQYEKTLLQDGDVVEVVSFVGGG